MMAAGPAACFHRPYLAMIVAVAASLFLRTTASPFRGVSPQDEKYYMDGALIWCKDGSKSFPRNRLNDDFCDCPDGTDEPGTSACPESKFYCRNAGDTPRYLFSSRVNDHICDCCDGSDEYDGNILCPNTCIKDENGLSISIHEQDSTKTKSDDINPQERMSKPDLEEFAGNLKGFRVAVAIELVLAICLTIFLLIYRHSRARRRRHLLRRN